MTLGQNKDKRGGWFSGRAKHFVVWLVLVFVCAAPVITTLVTYQLHIKQAEREAVLNAQKLGYVLMSHLDRTVEAIDTFMISFGNYLGEKWTPDDIYRELRNATLPASVVQLSLVDVNGRFIASNLAAPGTSNVDLSDREHIRAHLDGLIGDNVFISKPVKGRVSKLWTIQFSRAIRSETGRLLGILVASYEISDLVDFYARLRTDPHVIIALVGFDGIIRARVAGTGARDSVGQDISGSSTFQRMRSVSEGPYEAASILDGIDRIGYFVASKKYPLVVLVATDRSFVRSLSHEFMVAIAAVSGGLCVALLLMGIVFIRYNRLEQRLKEREIQSGARQREAQFLRAFGNMPGVSVVHVSGDVATPIGASSFDNASPVARYVRSRQFISQLGASDGSSVNVEHFTRDGEEFEIQYVVAQVAELDTRDKASEREMVVFALDRTAARTEENNLYQMSKMAALGELVTGLAHEINQPLGVIRLAAANALSGIKRGLPVEHVEEKLNRIVNQTARMKAIIDHMRIFGRKSELRPEPSSVSSAIDGALQVVGAQIRLDDITLTAPACACDEGRAKVMCRQEQLEQVLINLLLNARDAIRSRRQAVPGYRGSIDVTCTLETDEANRNTARIVVRDNAGGVPENIIGKVFQPFFTTKAAGQGTGLGLSVSFGIIRDHGGTLSVVNDSEGAVFTILLPALLPAEVIELQPAK